MTIINNNCKLYFFPLVIHNIQTSGLFLTGGLDLFFFSLATMILVSVTLYF